MTGQSPGHVAGQSGCGARATAGRPPRRMARWSIDREPDPLMVRQVERLNGYEHPVLVSGFDR